MSANSQINLLFVITHSALNRGMNTGLENLAWSLAETGCKVHIISGGSRPRTWNYKISENVSYCFVGDKDRFRESVRKTYVDLTSRIKIDFIIGWIFNVAAAVRPRDNYKPVILANQGAIERRNVRRKYRKIMLKRPLQIVRAMKEWRDIKCVCANARQVVSISEPVRRSIMRAYPVDPNI